MKLELTQTMTLRQRLENLLDLIAERIVDISDFFILKNITWTELALFGFCALRAAWFVVFGVVNANYDYYFNDHVWTTVFVVITLIHFGGFFLKSSCLRVAAGYCYAFVWLILTGIAVWSLTTAPAVPHFLLLTFLSIVVVVRLSRDHKCNE